MTILKKPASASGTWNQYIWTVVNAEPDEDFLNPVTPPETIRIITPEDIRSMKDDLLDLSANGGLKGIARKYNVPLDGIRRVYEAVKKKKGIVNQGEEI